MDLSSYLILVSWVSNFYDAFEYIQKKKRMGIMEIFLKLQKHSLWAFVGYKEGLDYFMISELISVVFLFICLVLHYKSTDNMVNIVYNTVIIVNVLWLINKEKMQYAEIAGVVLAISSFIFSMRTIKAEIAGEERKYQSICVHTALELVRMGVLLSFGWKSKHYSLLAEVALIPALGLFEQFSFMTKVRSLNETKKTT